MAQDTNKSHPQVVTADRITRLIEDYFAGKTTNEEEQELRHYFTSGDVAEEHRHLTPLFTEVRQLLAGCDTEELPEELVYLEKETKRSTRPSLLRLYRMGGIAATLLVAIVVGYHLLLTSKPRVEYSSTLFIAGEEIQDEEEATRRVEEAMQAVATPLSPMLPQLSLDID